MTAATATQPILLDLDEKTWADQLDRTTAWLGNVLMTQEKFREFAADTADRIHEPHIKQYLQDIAQRAAVHEEAARGLFRVIGREPSDGRSLAGRLLSRGSELVADMVGLSGGAQGNWKDLRQLLLANQDALGTFGIAEQLGYALGVSELAN